MRIYVIAGLLAVAPGAVSAQSFSCSFGQPACVNYNEKVVPQDAQCFDAYTCFPGGFICKSEHEEYVRKAASMAENYDTLRSCIARAEDMETVQRCLSTDTLMQ
ncbi:MAG TPA: hypothetical protein VGN97_15590 [Mesorhizobium sp.]|nr:hypothetical protein [Mesorhizobium sp.]